MPQTIVCSACGNLAEYSVLLDAAWLHSQRQSLHELGGGCGYCQLLAQIIIRNVSPDRFYIAVYDSCGESPGLLDIHSKSTSLGAFRIFAEQSTPNIRCLPAVKLYPANISSVSGHTGAVDFIHTQLRSCLSTHGSSCRRPSPLPPLPRRILRIETSPDILRLCQFGDSIRADYVALSYSWGGLMPPRTVAAEMESLMRNGIPFPRLPAVFRDAMCVCCEVGVEYLWIDSLCIVQDSVEDWQRESARMCEYYENALFTLSAASSPNLDASFLRERSPRWEPQRFQLLGGTVVSEVITPPAGAVQIIAQPVPRVSDGRIRTAEDAQCLLDDEEGLATRGWTFQESQLSVRVAEFAGATTRWACRWIHNPPLEYGGLIHGGLFGEGNHLCNQKLSSLTGLDDGETFEVWKHIVQQFSSRLLTYETDRLPALSGIAKKFQEQTGWRYVAGMWEEALLKYLPWAANALLGARAGPAKIFTLRRSAQSGKGGGIGAPSWSWASMGRAVHFRSWSFEPDKSLVVKDIVCRADGLNPFGAVDNDSHLLLRGYVFTIRISQEIVQGDSRTAVTVSCQHQGSYICVDSILIPCGGTLRQATADDAITGFTDLPAKCLFLGMQEDRSRSDYTLALILGEAEGDSGIYYRLGLAKFDDHDLNLLKQQTPDWALHDVHIR